MYVELNNPFPTMIFQGMAAGNSPCKCSPNPRLGKELDCFFIIPFPCFRYLMVMAKQDFWFLSCGNPIFLINCPSFCGLGGINGD